MDTKILKLTNGDEIITTLSGKSDTSVVTAHNPLKINSYPRVTKTGIEESMALSRWVSYGETDSCEIIKNNNNCKIVNQVNENYEYGLSVYCSSKIKLQNFKIFNFHLGMTGGWSTILIKHCHFRVFSKSKELFFKDVRKFLN